jgi:hypothetical protein
MKVGSFKNYLNDVKRAPYYFLLANEETKDGKAATEEPTKQDHDKEEEKSLLQYLLYANAKN